MIPKCFQRNEIHHSSSPVTPISVEQIKQEQARMLTRDTDWNLYDYGNVYQNKYSIFFSNYSFSLYFYSYQLGDLSNDLVGVDNMDREETKPDFGHLL